MTKKLKNDQEDTHTLKLDVDAGSVTGTVYEKISKEIVDGASVSLRNMLTGLKENKSTNEEGQYTTRRHFMDEGDGVAAHVQWRGSDGKWHVITGTAFED